MVLPIPLKNFNNGKDLGISECQVDRIERSRLQVRVIAEKYSTMCSQSSQPQGNVAEATLKRQVQGNAIGFVCVENGICVRNKHTCISSNDTKDSLTLFVAHSTTHQSE